MGQKVNPIGLRLGINRNWDSRWFPKKERTAAFIAEDYALRKFLKKELFYAGVASIIIERTAKKVRITIVTARPGIIIGKKGADIEKLKTTLNKMFKKDISLNIKEEKRAQASGQLAAENVATQLERRVAFRRAMKKVIQGALKSGAKGIKVSVSGRLGGAEMARTEWYLEGRVPLHTLRAKIDYGFAEAQTTYAIAEKIVLAIGGLFDPVNQALYPYLVRRYKENSEIFLQLIKKISFIFVGIAFMMLSISEYFKDEIVLLIRGEENTVIVFLLSIYLFRLCIFPFGGLFSNVLIIMNRKKEFMKIMNYTVILYTLLVIPSIYLYGAVGLVTSFVTILVAHVLLLNYYVFRPIKFEKRKND